MSKEYILLSKKRYEDLMNTTVDKKLIESNVDASTQTVNDIGSTTPDDNQLGKGLFVKRSLDDDGLPGIPNRSPRKKRKNIQWLLY